MKLRMLPARQGLQWALMGLRVFWLQPVALLGLSMFIMATLSLLSAVPLIGFAVALVPFPLVTLVMMVATVCANAGSVPTPVRVLESLRKNGNHSGRNSLRAMLTLGVLYALCFLAVVGLSATIDGGQFARIYLGMEALERENAPSGDFRGAMLLSLLLYIPLSLTFWHTPWLVHWFETPPLKALFFSVMACWRNRGAFAVYAAVWLGLWLGTAMAASVVIVILGLGANVAEGLMMMTLMVVMTVFLASTTFSCRDCFESQPSQCE